jgi:hypothetical protein
MATKTKKRPAKPLLAPRDGNCVMPLAVLPADAVLDVSSPMTFEMVINAELPETLAKAVERVIELDNTTKITKLLSVWETGRILEASGAGKYGEKAVETIAMESNIDKRTLQEYLKCYRTYPDFNVVKAFEIEWSSVREVMKLSKDTDRTRVANVSKKENLTCRQVRDEVLEVLKKETPKKPKTPKKPPSAVTYFEGLDAKTLMALQNLRDYAEKIPEMLKIAEDEKLTSEEDFIRLTEGKGNNPAILKRCNRSGGRLTGFVVSVISPLENIFDETPKAAQSGKAKKSKK